MRENIMVAGSSSCHGSWERERRERETERDRERC
jgi:hypothetical protein